ncbi:ABC transporter substrate-binding protein [Variovorax sp. CY25R-8]|uniref:ABC transporter substrate-binding protein n=1 Tax=Variovorax sp. CY25R-8 TaxID=2855501 RepID=UPI0021BA80B6|nr:ABC transporter substrate-binding protein [Variovorax sp. CY25R-8]MCT8180100.1 ABC transporter substrate-binding protein [Variovorax sp. CY25R-8]
MKRPFRVALLALVLAPFAALPAHAADARVSVTAIVDHPALDAARQGIVEELAAAGYVVGKNLRLDYQSAQGNTATAAQIARKFVGDRPDVIVAMSTPSAQTVVAATREIPIVFSAVTDPVAAKLVKSWEATGGNVTGVSDLPLLDKHLALLRQALPTAKRIGVVYNPGEANSVAAIAQLKKLAQPAGLSVIEGAAPRTVDVASAAQSLVGKVDAIYAPTDNNVTSAFEALAKVADQGRVPLIAADPSLAARGAALGIGTNYHDLGRQSGKLVVRVLKGESPGSIASQVSPTLELLVNQAAARRQGLALSDALLKSATRVID